MDFFELLKKRCSIRAYSPKEISESDITQILDAANRAPSAGNLQAYEIFMVSSSEKKAALANAAYGQNFIAQASIVLCFCANKRRSSVHYGNRGVKLYSVQDATIAVTFAMLAAEALGLSSCWIGAFDDNNVQRVLNIQEKKNIVPIAILPIGYPRESPNPTQRRSLESLVHEIE